MWAQSPDTEIILQTRGGTINSFITSDINGDGTDEFIENMGNTFIIKYNNGGSLWQNSYTINETSNYYSSEIVAADINMDGFNDIITFSSLYHNCKWLENPTDGSANWTEHTVAGSYRYLMGVFDVDGDLMPDIFFENTSFTLGWIKNVDGNFITFTTIPDSYSPTQAKGIADFDQDGDTDMTLYFDDCCIKYFRNNSNGTFTVSSISSDEYQDEIIVTDTNDDGFADIVYHYASGYDVAVFNPVSDVFDSPTFFGTYYAIQTTFSDIDGDGDDDFIVISDEGVAGFYTLKYCENNGGFGTLTTLNDSIPEYDGKYYFYDYNFDGRPDLFSINQGKIYVDTSNFVTEEITAEFSPELTYLRMDLIRYFDVNNDGDEDIMLANNDGVVGWIDYDEINDTIDNVHHLPKIDASPYPVAFQEADLDNDGDMDLVSSFKSFYGGEQISYYFLNNGTGNFTMYNFSAHAYGQLYFLDADEDGDLDFVGYDISSKSLVLYLNTGIPTSMFSLSSTISTGTVYGADMIDYDNDGDLDFIHSKYLDTYLQVIKNEPGLPFSVSTDLVLHGCSTATLVYTEDFDDNGLIDIGYTCNSGAFNVKLNIDGAYVSAAYGSTVGIMDFGPSYTTIADVNQDNIEDFIVSSYTTGTHFKLSDGPGIYLPTDYTFSPDYGRFAFVNDNDIIDFIGTNNTALYVIYDVTTVAPDITVTAPAVLWLEEGGATATFSIVANTIPANDLEISIVPDATINCGAGEGLPLIITIPNDSTALIPQIITCLVPEDTEVENIYNQPVAITTTAPTWGMFAGLIDDAFEFMISDNDFGLFVSHTGVSLAEGVAATTIEFNINKVVTDPVELTINPDADIALNGVLGTPAAIDIPTGLGAVATFSYTVANVNDYVDESSVIEYVNYDFSSADIYINDFIADSLAVTLTDNDVANVIRLSGNDVITEGIEVFPLDVKITSAPTADVFVTLTPNIQLNLGAGAGMPVTLTFSAGLTIPDAITTNVYGVEDGIAEPLHSGVIAFTITSADPLYNDELLGNLTISIEDVETVGIDGVASDETLIITPTVGTGLFEVALSETVSAIIVVNSLGQTIFSEENNGKTTQTIDLTGLPAGTYFISAISSDSVTTTPFHITH